MSEEKSDTLLTLKELDDKPGKVYIMAVSLDAHESYREWYLSEKASERINSYFDPARILILSGDIDGDLSMGEIIPKIECTVTNEPISIVVDK
jgi:hypothetical protein